MPVSEKKLRSNPAWIKRHLTDPFVKKSVQEGYRARSVYKLMEIDDKDKIIKPGMSVVDLGAAPGSWTQIVKERLTDKDGKIDGKVIAMDILPMEPIEGVHFLQGDFQAIVWFATTSSIKDSKALSPSPAVSVDSKILILSIFVSLKTTSTVMVPLFPVPVAV